MASINKGYDAQVGDLSTAIAQWLAAATLVNAAVQYLPPGGAAASGLTLLAGHHVVNRGIVIDTIHWRYTGDAANVAGQLLVPSISRIPAAGGAEVVLFTASAGTPTTAGVQTGTFTTTTPVELLRGDLLIGRVTPSALLTAVCTGVTLAVG
jgi:hypothetical protein